MVVSKTCLTHSENTLIKVLLAFVALSISMEVGATHLNIYYVYHETDYVQGSWRRAELLDAYGYRYLAPQQHEDYFGTVRSDLVHKLLGRLSAQKPEVYDWPYNLTIDGNTVVVASDAAIPALETVQNEITATLVLNNFEAVRFQLGGKQETWTLDSLTLPFLDLVTRLAAQPATSVDAPSPAPIADAMEDAPPQQTYNPRRNPLMAWLMASGILNLIFMVFWIRSRSRP